MISKMEERLNKEIKYCFETITRSDDEIKTIHALTFLVKATLLITVSEDRERNRKMFI